MAASTFFKGCFASGIPFNWAREIYLHSGKSNDTASRSQSPGVSLDAKRYSWHYYDLYCIAHFENKQAAYDNLELLEKVVAFKTKFYPRRWAQYDQAKPETTRLLPPDYRLEHLRENYASISEMMFGDYPDFETLMFLLVNFMMV